MYIATIMLNDKDGQILQVRILTRLCHVGHNLPYHVGHNLPYHVNLRYIVIPQLWYRDTQI